MAEPRSDDEILARTLDDLTPPQQPLKTLLREFMHGSLRHLTWAEFEARFRRTEGL